MAQGSDWKQLFKPQFVERDTEIETLFGVPADRAGSIVSGVALVSAFMVIPAVLSGGVYKSKFLLDACSETTDQCSDRSFDSCVSLPSLLKALRLSLTVITMHLEDYFRLIRLLCILDSSLV